jgi:hypothetical protein
MRGDDVVDSWSVLGEGRPDLAVVDDLTRVQLEARRRGYAVRLRDVCPDLRQLLDLAGLIDVFGGRCD